MADTAHTEHLDTESERMHHVTPPKLYYGIFGALMVLTLITIAVAFVDLGWVSTPIALIIAAVKASLVILFFMHVRWSSHLIWIVVIGSLAFVGILFVLSYSDYFSRGLSMT